MNPPITFPAPAPVLKLARPSTEKWAATLAEERRRLQEDQDALHEREVNLREYESRLRAWQAEIDAGRGGAIGERPAAAPVVTRTASGSPFVEDAALQAAWEKLHRARELLEAEQTHLRGDRLTMRDQEAALKQREEALAFREAQVAEREAMIAAAQPIASEHTMSAVTRLTRAPFDMARSVFSGKK